MAEPVPPADDLILAELPPGLDVLWGRKERGRTGPKPSLSIDTIVATAIRIADDEGLAAVSMARLARELGFSTMSMYRYVRSKDELHLLMWNSSAAGLGEISGGTWRERLADWAEAQRAAVLLRSWLLEMPLAAPPAGPQSLAFVEQALAAMADTPLREAEKMAVIGAVSIYSLGDARMAHQAAKAAAVTGQPEADYGAVLRTVVTADEYPALHRLAWSPDMTARPRSEELPPGVDQDLLGFRFGLNCILDGIQALIDRRDPTVAATGKIGGRRKSRKDGSPR
ncbi:TetR/AcrR family transcriptional regulator [Nakamurella lactea]|uniref:TetR/AcrR family transcriptional regulator n=1 Tax=Nakamurella lactea TaxID=459515 RepID=UPI0004093DB9|nr:TetR/AcrR family transcriptional regulator [Nakamurella lactea]